MSGSEAAEETLIEAHRVMEGAVLELTDAGNDRTRRVAIYADTFLRVRWLLNEARADQ